MTLPMFVTLKNCQDMYVETTRIGWREGNFTKKRERETAALVTLAWESTDDEGHFNMFVNFMLAHRAVFKEYDDSTVH